MQQTDCITCINISQIINPLDPLWPILVTEGALGESKILSGLARGLFGRWNMASLELLTYFWPLNTNLLFETETFDEQPNQSVQLEIDVRPHILIHWIDFND